MKNSELERIRQSGADIKSLALTSNRESIPSQEVVMRLKSDPQVLEIKQEPMKPQEVSVHVETETQVVEVEVEIAPLTVDVDIDVQGLIDQVNNLGAIVQQLITERRKPFELEIIRNGRGEMTGVKGK